MWIESHQSLRNHPKVKKAARIAGVNEFEMIGRIHCLWWWALDYAPDGDLTNYSDDDIEAAVDWTGQPGLFVRSMIECGFNGHGGLIDVTQESREIHDWFEYAGKLLERRAANADRMREARATHVQGTQRARVGLPNQPNQPNQPDKPDRADKPRSKTAKETCPAEWMTALYTLTQSDPALASVGLRKRISETGKALIKAGAKLEDVERFSAWWTSDKWRLEHTPTPTPEQVRDNWQKMNGFKSSGNGHNTSIDDEHAAALKRAYR